MVENNEIKAAEIKGKIAINKWRKDVKQRQIELFKQEVSLLDTEISVDEAKVVELLKDEQS